MIKSIQILLLSFLLGSVTQAQYLVSAEYVETVTAADLSAQFGIFASYDIDSYKILYTTKDLEGNDHTASGLLSLPKNSTVGFPMLAVMHGTVSGRENVPSRLAGGYELGLVFSTFGFYTVQPDLIGLGDSPGIHPYVHADSEAWAGRDLLRAAREFAEENDDVIINDQVFVSGYSQGGHAGMALHRLLELEHSEEFEMTAASHMSGPYSVSEKMIDFTLGESEYLFSAYLAWVALSLQVAYPVELADHQVAEVFKAQYVDDIMAFANEDIDLNELNTRLQNGLIAEVGQITPKDLLIPEILDAIRNDSTHPLSVALAKQDVYDWAPKAPTRLMYCTSDDQVTFENAILAEQVMKANGTEDIEAIECGATFDHGGCVAPAMTNSILFFLNLVRFTSSVDEEILSSIQKLRVGQSGDVVYIMADDRLLTEQVRVEIHNSFGLKLYEESLNQDHLEINVSTYPAGVYVINITSGHQLIQSEKIFIE